MTNLFLSLLTVAAKITRPVLSLASSLGAFALLLLGSCVLLVISWIKLPLIWFGKQIKTGKKRYSDNVQLQRNIYWYFIMFNMRLRNHTYNVTTGLYDLKNG